MVEKLINIWFNLWYVVFITTFAVSILFFEKSLFIGFEIAIKALLLYSIVTWVIIILEALIHKRTNKWF